MTNRYYICPACDKFIGPKINDCICQQTKIEKLEKNLKDLLHHLTQINELFCRVYSELNTGNSDGTQRNKPISKTLEP